MKVMLHSGEIERNPDGPIVFIQRDEGGRVKPCSPNKILVSRTTTLRPFKRILPHWISNRLQDARGPPYTGNRSYA